jgi:hypothetical protein
MVWTALVVPLARLARLVLLVVTVTPVPQAQLVLPV